MPPKLLAPTNVEIEADGLDLVHACCARLGIPNTLRNAISARLGVAADYSVQFLAPLTDAERIDTVENVALVDEDNEPRVPTLFEKSPIRSRFRLADIMVAGLARPPVVRQVAQAPWPTRPTSATCGGGGAAHAHDQCLLRQPRGA